MEHIKQSLDIMRRLRDPQQGCAWDVKQSFSSIAPYTIEEAYEVADAIERDDMVDLKDELGDLLFQVIFHARLAEEQGLFDFEDVVESLNDKLVRRHPHVFSDVKYANDDEMSAAWEQHKQKEHKTKSESKIFADNVPDGSALSGVTLGLPALMRAQKIQKKASRVGFDWPTIEPVIEKVHEELDELYEAIAEQDVPAQQDELGDVLFSVVNLSRHLKLDSEACLQGASKKFISRFVGVEALAAESSVDLKSTHIDDLEQLWLQSKARIATQQNNE